MITNDVYRTESGRYEFEFNFVEQGQFVEIDIVKQPTYGSRSDDLHSTHRLPSDRGGQKICFGEPAAVNTLNKAYKYAASWAESTEDYIVNGTTF